MTLDSITAQTTTLAENAAKSGLHALWSYAAFHPRSFTVGALALILVSGFIGFAIGAGA